MGRVPSRRRLAYILSICVGIVVAVGVVSATLVVPYYHGHYTCVRGTLVKSQFNWTPDLLMNSPFGGKGVDSYSLPPVGAQSGGGTQFNGTSSSVIWPSLWNLSTVQRVLVNGAGADAQCPQYEVDEGSAFSYLSGLPFGGCAGCPITVVNNTTDRGEASQVSYNSTNGGPRTWSVIWDNAFTVDNQGQISTCGAGARWANLTTHNFTFEVSFSTAKGTLDFNESIYSAYGVSPPPWNYTASFSYWFPANFGTWQLDNLSAPGGPGGGWAFNFVGYCT
jgi:hypothetical protein